MPSATVRKGTPVALGRKSKRTAGLTVALFFSHNGRHFLVNTV